MSILVSTVSDYHAVTEKPDKNDDDRDSKHDQKSKPIIHQEKVSQKDQCRKGVLYKAYENIRDPFLHHREIGSGSGDKLPSLMFMIKSKGKGDEPIIETSPYRPYGPVRKCRRGKLTEIDGD